MTDKKQNRNLFYVGGFLLLLIMIAFGYVFKNRAYSDIQNGLMIQALQTGLKKTIDKQGRETSEKQILITSYKQLKAVHVSDSSVIGRLQKIITKNTTAAVIIQNHTSGHLSSHAPHVTFNDFTDSLTKTDNCNPVFQDTLKDPWTNIKIYACKDSINADYTVTNEYAQTQEFGAKQGKWPFKYRQPVIRVKNLNPHTKTDEINAWAVQVPNIKKKVTTGITISLISGLILGLLIKR